MKKQSIKLLLGFILLFLSTQNVAQTLRDGFVIKNSGDTVNGQIKYRAGHYSSLVCNFHYDENTVVDYKPGEIFGYRLKEGKYYISKQIPIDGEARLLFAEYLIKGVANLYYVNFRNVDHYFVETDKSGLIELTEPERIIETDSGNFVLPPKYKGKLTYTLSDYDQIQNEVEYLSLNHKSLIKLAKNYHNAVCDSVECLIFEKKIVKLWLGYSLSAGYTLSRYNFGQLLDSDFGSGFIVGASVILNNVIVSNERFTLQLGLSYQKQYQNTFVTGKKSEFGARVDYEDKPYLVNPFKEDSSFGVYSYVKSLQANIGVSALKIPLVLNYSGLSKTYRPYFGVGFSTMIVISQNEKFIYEHFKAIYGETIPQFLFGFKAKVGISRQLSKRQSLFFQVDYDYLINYNINNFLRLRVNSFQFQFGFRF